MAAYRPPEYPRVQRDTPVRQYHVAVTVTDCEARAMGRGVAGVLVGVGVGATGGSLGRLGPL